MRKPGKKIDMLEVDHGAHTHKVELRLDKERNTFFAELGGDSFSSHDLAELKKQLQAKAKQMASYEFRWWIDISFEASRGNRRTRWGSDFEDLTPENIASINFSFDVHERSQPIESEESGYRDKKVYYEMTREIIEVDGELQPDEAQHESKRVYDRVTIEYTPERYAKLKAIRAGLYELARRLNEVVGDSEKAAAALDGGELQKLLSDGQ